jgi:hypothetical protein
MDLSQWFQEQLQASAEGFIWSVLQVPEARRNLQPPIGLGEWSAARHTFHLLYYEQTIALPSMKQWLDEPMPSDRNEDVAWIQNSESIENFLEQFHSVREQQIAILPKFEQATWHAPRRTIWGIVPLLWVVSKTFQHTAEHTSDVLQLRLWWDASPST